MNRLKKGSRDELVSPGEAIRYMIKRTESPIEKMFAEAWGDLLDEKNWPERTLIFNYGPFKYLPEVTIYSPLNYMAADFFCPQLEVGEYRVDFVLGRIAAACAKEVDEMFERLLMGN